MYSSLDLNLDLATMEGVATRINLLIVLNLVRRLYSCTFENTKFSITTDLHQSTCILEYNPESALCSTYVHLILKLHVIVSYVDDKEYCKHAPIRYVSGNREPYLAPTTKYVPVRTCTAP